ncbi:nicotinate-nucleotide pyrophosphorylase [carboxylating]-like [Biomphalaria glabrata]|uniref:Nicotinate-nucleotide pyrophosphorylase [carboxylating] n=1 Tax=Biomphalaria glabrata TaxID=6526 RepID=A0A9W2YIE9_BIOGL|nr:nicotinate-nucleotide pyrophosphorylase [carboxylating]-like [Biomphalaria glabrata]XP_055862507.1 nicotinate-nucleotide pyrophosphorylase [carboxylating]-like [Biomphalaria glabrata]XP_055862508.1 nicotinate-nucleotide pyrophosphorylase [carboxylating]-like [Biomphalaria glabrata]
MDSVKQKPSHYEEAILNKICIQHYHHILTPISLQHLAREWLKEDVPSFDYAGFVVGEKQETAVLLLKEAGVLAGRPFVDAIFKELDCVIVWHAQEGDYIEPVKQIATVTGKVRHLLLGERVALNCITRASGIATIARRLAQKAKACGWKGEVAGTRKTTPGFRLVEKYALVVGGVSTHRHDLSSMVMLKDNHIWTAGSITQAVRDAKVVGGFSLKIEVECRSLEEAMEAAEAGADIVMLDNFSSESAEKASKELKLAFPKLLIEISGGITEENLTEFCLPEVDVISLGKLTQGYTTIDMSFKINKAGKDLSNPTVLSV